MLLDTRLSDEQQALVREMRDNTDGLLAILNDILDFSKMSVGALGAVDHEVARQRAEQRADRSAHDHARRRAAEFSPDGHGGKL